MQATTYKLQETSVGPYINYRVSVPSPIGQQLPREIYFECEPYRDGILYRPSTPLAVAARRYKLGQFVNGRTKSGKPHVAYWMTVPRSLGPRFAGRRFTCALTEHGLVYEVSDLDQQATLPAWARRDTLADELARRSPQELSEEIYFTKDVVADHAAIWSYQSHCEAAGDLCAAVRDGRLTGDAPTWSEAPRDGAAMIRVGDEMTLMVVRGRRHASGETWRKPYLVIKAFYGPAAGIAEAA